MTNVDLSSDATIFNPGETVVWAPRKARQKCYEHPIAYQSLDCKIISGPHKNDYYYVEIVNKRAQFLLGKGRHHVNAKSLHRKEQDGNQRDIKAPDAE